MTILNIMKSIIPLILFFCLANLGYSQCSIFGPTSILLNQTATFNIPSSPAQCGSCYDWDVSGSGQVIGSDMGSSAQIRRTGTGAITISVTYFDETGCHSCSVTIAALGSSCNFTVAILDEYIDGTQSGSNLVYLLANTIPQVGPGATYTWTVNYQNGTSYTGTTTQSPSPIPAYTNNRIVSASVVVNYLTCTASDSRIFLNPIPDIGFGSGFGSGKVQSTGELNLGDADEQKFRLFPNPATSNIQIEGPELVKHTISILDMQGKVILEESDLTKEIDLEGKATGAYFYIIKDEDGQQQSGKIIKQD